MTALIVILTLVVVLLAVLVAGLLRSHAEVLRALHELGVSLDPDDGDLAAGVAGSADTTIDLRTRPGVAAPRATVGGPVDVVGRTPDGGLAKVGVTGTDGLTLLAFLSSGCLTCAGFWDAFADPQQRQVDGLDAELVIVAKGPELESEASIRAMAPKGVRTVMSSEAWLDYEVPVSPYFILIDGQTGDTGASRIVGEGAASTWEQVANLLKQAVADAGIAQQRAAGRRAKGLGRTGPQRHADTDDELRQAGIEPGDPSLYPIEEQHAIEKKSPGT